MEMPKLTQYTMIKNARRAHPVMFDRITAGLAVVAWLALAGDAFAQGANQWAPQSQGQPTPVQNAHVWSNGGSAQASVFAPADLDRQLSNGLVTPAPATLIPSAQPAQSAVATPIYAPAELARPAAQAPVQPPAQPSAAPLGYAPNGYAPQFGVLGMGNGYPVQPYGAGFGGMPFAGGGYGVPGNYPYGNGYGPGFGNGYGYNIPSSSVWGGPNNSNYSNTGIPFFGGTPFGFW